MANKTLHSLQFPGLSDTYVLPEEASEFSTSSTYAVGQYVTYRGVLYKCITAVSHAGSWTGSTNWSATDVGTELQDTYGPSRPNFSTNTPVMDGAASTGSATTYARSDHRHPSDTTKLNVPDNAGTLGQALTKTATGSTWKTLTEGINPNLLRNWYFVGGGTGKEIFPVNSRGLTSYTATGAVTIDQWIKGDSSNLGEVSLTSGGLTISHSASTGYTQISQNIVNPFIKDFGLTPYYNKLATISVLINNQLYSAQLYLGEQTSSLFLGGLLIFSILNQQLILRVSSSSSVTMIQAVKLELGDQQTLCHQENGVWVLNEIPDYEEEYYRCKTSTADSSDIYANKVLSTNIPNRNLLDNWYFVNPVNQRGATQYSGNVTAFDRWRIENQYGQSIELTSSGVRIIGTSSLYNGIVQIFENPTLFNGKTLTISCLFSDGVFLHASGVCSLGSSNVIIFSAGASLDGSPYIFLYGSTSSLSLHIRCNTNTTKTVVAAKVEFGTEQTLAHQENGVWMLNEIPDYGEELRKCQRYLLVLSPLTDNYGFIGFANGNPNAGGASVIINTPVTMRNGTPSIQKSGDWRLCDRIGGTTISVTSITTPRLTQNAVAFIAMITGATAGRLYEMASYNDASAQLIISVEL